MHRLWHWVKDHTIPHAGNAYRPHLLRRGWLVFFLAMVLATEGFLVASLVARQSGGSFLAEVIASQLISLTNEQRASESLTILSENSELDAAAQAKAQDMAAKGYFAHVGPDGKQPWDWIAGSGYDYQYAGENLAVRFIDSKDVINAWMESPTHRANIEKGAYREIGIGIAQGVYKGESATYVVQYFGSPAAVARAAATPAQPAAATPVQDSTAAEPVLADAEPAPQTAPTVVLGAESPTVQTVAPSSPAAHQTESWVQSLGRTFAQALSDPRHSTSWVIGGVAALLVLLIALAFFLHIHIQPTNMLLSGAAVAGVALMLLGFNASILGASGGQSASAVQAGGEQRYAQLGAAGVVLDDMAAATSR